MQYDSLFLFVMKDGRPSYKILDCEANSSGSRIDNPLYDLFHIEIPHNFKLMWIMVCDLLKSRMDVYLVSDQKLFQD